MQLDFRRTGGARVQFCHGRDPSSHYRVARKRLTRRDRKIIVHISAAHIIAHTRALAPRREPRTLNAGRRTKTAKPRADCLLHCRALRTKNGSDGRCWSPLKGKNAAFGGDSLGSLDRSGKAQLMAVRIADMEIPLPPRGIRRRGCRCQPVVQSTAMECVDVGYVKDHPPPP